MLRIISIMLLCFNLGQLMAQGEIPEKYLEIRGVSELEMEPLGRATANLYEGSTKIKSIQTGADGSFAFKLEINKQYTIEVEKEGLISKRISFNTQMPDEEKGTWMSEFSIGLIKSCNGVDYSALKDPVDRVSFDAKRREFISDKNYVNNMRSRIENVMIKTDECLLNNYEATLKKADQLVAQKNYNEALKVYDEASKIYPREAYPSKRITEINTLLSKQQSSAEATAIAEQQAAKKAELTTLEKYNQAMAMASVAYTRKDYDAAKQYYQEALLIKPGESLPKSRVQEIETIQAKKAAENVAKAAEIAQKAAFEKEYQNLVAQADEQFKAKKFDEAKATYAKAILMKPAESYPAQRVKVIETAIASERASVQKNKDESYNNAMTAGNNALAKNQFQLAKDSYQQALAIKPDDLAAKSRFAEVDKLAAEFAKQKNIEEQYNNLIQSGDAQIAKKELVEAKATFNQALTLKPGDKYATTKITAIDNTIAAQQAALAKTQNDQYGEAISNGNNALAQNQFALAKESFQKALTFKANDYYALNRITETDRLSAQHSKQIVLNEEYKKLIQTADNLMSGKELTKARESYSQALGLKPGDQYAQGKISTIDITLAAEQAAKLRVTEEGYKAAICAANSAIAQKSYSQAKEFLQKALTIKPGDAYAAGKVAEVDKLIADKQKEEQERIAEEQAKKKKYDDIVLTADKYYTQKNYASAKTYYEQALVLHPSDIYPRQKLGETLKAIEEQERIITEARAKESAYNIALVNADKFFKAKDYIQAKDEYSRASVLKPDEAFPKTRISELESLIALKIKEQTEAKNRADAYTAAINSGNAAFNKKDYPGAKLAYNEALKHMPGDLLANDQIKKIDYLMAEAEKMRKAEQEKKATYDALIASADKSFDGGKYPEAKDNYKKALVIDPSSTYAKQRIVRIEEITRILAQSNTKTTTTSTPGVTSASAAISLKELVFKNESERQTYLDELMKKYPSGITLEKYKEQYKETLRYIIIRDNQAQEFRHVKYTTYSGAQYSVNGKPITQQYFLTQTKTREGESFKEISMQ